MPALEIVPQRAGVQPVPETLQVTAVFDVPLTWTLNWNCRPIVTTAFPGVTTTVTAERMVTTAEALLVGSVCDVAVTAIFGGVGTVAGAVYKPLLSTVPHAEPAQPAEDTLQLTAVLVVPVTVAVNCLVSPANTRALVGEILTTTGASTVTVAVPDLEGSACEVAITATVGGLGSVLGAVYKPAPV